MTNHIPYKVYDEITDLFQSFNGEKFALEVWEGISNYIPHFTVKKKHFYEIFIIDYGLSCQYGNFQSRQWWKFRQNGDIYVSVVDVTT